MGKSWGNHGEIMGKIMEDALEDALEDDLEDVQKKTSHLPDVIPVAQELGTKKNLMTSGKETFTHIPMPQGR
jgi:hypothetical protein